MAGDAVSNSVNSLPAEGAPPVAPAPLTPPRQVVVEFADATLLPALGSAIPLRHVNLQLAAHEVCVVCPQRGREFLPLADAALGLLPPKSGQVLWRGRAWSDYSVDEQLGARQRFGRVFWGEAWISNLDLWDNVLLPRRHHSRLPDVQIEAQTRVWAAKFGLEDIPRRRPSLVPLAIRRVSEWVRAFADEPDVLLLEAPTRDAPDEAVERLRTAIAESARRGAAVLLQTTEERIWHGWRFEQQRNYRVVDEGRLEVVETIS